MKLNFIKNPNEEIEGYENIQLEKNQIPSVNQVFSNSCELILTNSALDFYKNDKRIQFVELILSKLRLGGKIIFSGIDPRALCKAYFNHQLSSSQLCEIFENTDSVIELSDLIESLQNMNLELETYKINGVKYEITAKRIR